MPDKHLTDDHPGGTSRPPAARAWRRPLLPAAVAAAALAGSLVPAWPSTAAPPPAPGAAGGAPPAAGRTFAASTAAQLGADLAQARPGDRVEVADGVYAAPIRLTRSGTAAAPIVVAAAHAGGAELSGPATFQFAGASHVVISGFRFTGSAGLDIPVGAQANRITRNTFSGSKSGNWVTVSAD